MNYWRERARERERNREGDRSKEIDIKYKKYLQISF